MTEGFPARPYRLTFEHRPDYLYVYLKSPVTSFEIACSYWKEILSLLHRRSYSRILLDKNVAQTLPARDVFKLVTRLAHTGVSEVSFAIVDRNFDRERCSFEELVGTNRGLNIRIMSELDHAEKWLLAQQGFARIKILPQRDEVTAPRWAA